MKTFELHGCTFSSRLRAGGFLIFFLSLTLSISTAAQAQIQGDSWMEDLWDTPNFRGELFQNRRLRDIVIPGSHDSATYALTDVGAPGANAYLSALAALPGMQDEIIKGYATAQSLTIYQQLIVGARFMDLRFAKVGNEYLAHHSLLGSSHVEVFADIKQFLDEGHDKEVIVLRFNGMIMREPDELKLEDHKEFVADIFSQFGQWMVPNSSGFNATPGDLYDMDPGPNGKHKQLIVFYEGVSLNSLGLSASDRKLLWDTNGSGVDSMSSSWFGKIPENGGQYPNPSLWRSEEMLFPYLSKLPGPTDNESAYVVALPMGMREQDFSMFLNLVVPDSLVVGYSSLFTASSFTNPRLVPHLISLPRENLNIVTVDYFQFSGLLEQAILLNSDPARVTLSVKSVSGESSGEFYPRFHVSTNNEISPFAFEPTDQLNSDSTISLFEADDHPLVVGYTNPITRNDGGPFNPTHRWEEPTWTYTVAAPWDKSLLTSVAIWEQDWFPGADDFTGISAELFDSPLSSYGEFSQLVQGGTVFNNIIVGYDVRVGNWTNNDGICPPDDRYENNDSKESATLLTDAVRVAGIICSNDKDWYSIPLQAFDTVSVAANFAHIDGDINIELWDPSGEKVYSSISTSNEEKISHQATQSGFYKILVDGAGGSQNRYSLMASTGLLPLMFSNSFEGNAPPAPPDLVVIDPGVSTSALLVGQSYDISATVKNVGFGASAVTELEYFLSSDNRITSSDGTRGIDAIPTLSPNAESSQDISSTAPVTKGTYYVGACVKVVEYETQQGNQCSSGVEINVVEPPDLIVFDPSVAPGVVVVGNSYTFEAAARNIGGILSDPSTITYHLSTDTTITTGDLNLDPGTIHSIPALPAGFKSNQLILLDADRTGTYFIGACVAVVANEVEVSNQCSDGVLITFISI